MMSHVVLLGDSIFDNAAYVANGPDVVTQVSERLPPGWRASLRAVDGSVIRDVRRQLEDLPADTSHLVLSVGGNDALRHGGILEESARRSPAEVLAHLARISEEFQDDYHRMLQAVLRCALPTVVCTIYYPRFPEPLVQRIAVTALSLFNDCITREAFATGVPLIDLRLICNEDADYANPIEPSARGGRKIAGAIMKAITEHDFERHRTEVFV